MLHSYRWKSATATTAVVTTDLPSTSDDLTDDEVYWIDLEDPTSQEEDLVLKQFLPIHPLTLEDVQKPRRDPGQGAHLPKVEEFRDYLFVIVNPLPSGFADSENGPVSRRLATASRPQLSVILTRHVLITHHYEKLPPVAGIRDYVQRHVDCGQRGPDYLFHLILDAMVDDYAPVVEGVSDRLDQLEARLFTRPTRDLLARLLRMKREVTFLRKTLILEREVLYRLTRGEFALIEPREIAYYRNVYDHVVRYADLIESAREMTSDLMQTHLAAVSNRLNEIMKVLTMISTIVLPMTLIAGVYGMNFDRSEWPDFESPWGFGFAVALMILTGVVALVYFRRQRWL